MQTLEHAGSRRRERKQKSINARCFLLASPHSFIVFRRCWGAKQQSWRWQFGCVHTCTCVCKCACMSVCTVNWLLCNSFKILLTETHSQCVCVERMSRGFSWMEMACSFRDISWRCTMPPHTHTHRMGSGVCIDVSFAFNLQNSSSLQFLRPCGSIIICHKMNSVIKKAGSALPVLVLGWDWNWQRWENNKTLQSKVALPFRRVWPESRFSNKCVLPFKCTFFFWQMSGSTCVSGYSSYWFLLAIS